MAAIAIERDPFHGEWNYTSHPTSVRHEAVIPRQILRYGDTRFVEIAFAPRRRRGSACAGPSAGSFVTTMQLGREPVVR
jgi:hypothetical protein